MMGEAIVNARLPFSFLAKVSSVKQLILPARSSRYYDPTAIRLSLPGKSAELQQQSIGAA